jgi:hypothetical protein
MYMDISLGNSDILEDGQVLLAQPRIRDTGTRSEKDNKFETKATVP